MLVAPFNSLDLVVSIFHKAFNLGEPRLPACVECEIKEVVDRKKEVLMQKFPNLKPFRPPSKPSQSLTGCQCTAENRLHEKIYWHFLQPDLSTDI